MRSHSYLSLVASCLVTVVRSSEIIQLESKQLLQRDGGSGSEVKYADDIKLGNTDYDAYFQAAGIASGPLSSSWILDALIIKGQTSEHIIALSGTIDIVAAAHGTDVQSIRNNLVRPVSGMKPDPTPFPHSNVNQLLREMCQTINELGTVVEGKAQDSYEDEWSTMWETFESTFESASDEAHAKVLSAIANLDAESWPTIASPPVQPHDATPAQQKDYHQQLQNWFNDNLFTIPVLQFGIKAQYQDMFYIEMLDAVYLKLAKSSFAKDPLAFENLTRAFLYRVALPAECISAIPESLRIKKKMKNMRMHKDRRDSEVSVSIGNYWRLRKAATLQMMQRSTFDLTM